MKLIIDDADVKAIRRIWDYYPCAGVTTNPSILAKSGRPPFEVLREIRAIIGPDAQLHAQVIAREADGMVKDAERIVRELGDNTYVKVPSLPEGFKAMKALHANGIKITATAIYTPMQGYLAGMCGAQYAAPYVNRIDNMGYDGIKVACEIHEIYKKNDIPCEVLAASFKNSQQVLELCKYGIGAATVACSVIDNFVKNAAIDEAVEAFIHDFEGLTAKGTTMSSC
ncbi:transaldolase family protein [uncultured Mitsuokella sp.]|uniref:transaldolase family protein n=1 Tax=uncultured Mitsuokella sp. TaxID=453120 RepID=UPI0026187AC6|nr:transaldolase family protein [uncultured Mitsuokella sp.]